MLTAIPNLLRQFTPAPGFGPGPVRPVLTAVAAKYDRELVVEPDRNLTPPGGG